MIPLILNIETATSVCSVSIAKGDEIIALKEINNGFTHAENLHVFIKDIFAENKLTLQQLGAIALSKGPGSYTGLRIGASTAKGLCYGLKIPLIAINTLKNMAAMALHEVKDSTALYCPMLDARRMEVYCAMYDGALNEYSLTEAKIINENSIQDFNKEQAVYFFGEGMTKCQFLLEKIPEAKFIEEIYPSAKFMAKLTHEAYSKKQFEDTAYFEPLYLKEFYMSAG